MGTSDAMNFLLDKFKATKNNGEFFQSMGTNAKYKLILNKAATIYSILITLGFIIIAIYHCFF